MISTEARIMVEHRFLVNNLVLVLDLVVKILVLVGSTSFLVLDLMVKILVLVGSSMFFIRILIIVESWFSVSSCGSWISVSSTKNEFFLLVPCAFFRVIVWNCILVLIVCLPLSTIDSNPLEVVMFWNQ